MKIINRFRKTYYTLKFKEKLRKWLWENVREPKIAEKYHPYNLQKLLENVEEDDESELDRVLDEW